MFLEYLGEFANHLTGWVTGGVVTVAYEIGGRVFKWMPSRRFAVVALLAGVFYSSYQVWQDANGHVAQLQDEIQTQVPLIDSVQTLYGNVPAPFTGTILIKFRTKFEHPLFLVVFKDPVDVLPSGVFQGVNARMLAPNVFLADWHEPAIDAGGVAALIFKAPGPIEIVGVRPLLREQPLDQPMW